MPPRTSLIDQLRSGGYEAALFTTFNAYLPFYEDVVLRRLMGAGVRHNVLLMDQAQYGAALQSDPPRYAGRRYTLVPVRVPGAFHPKLLFLVGKNKGLVAIGSHNLTLAGFGFNRELTNLLNVPGDSDPEALQLARHTWESIRGWLDLARSQVPDAVLDVAFKVKDFAPWLEQASPPQQSSIHILSCAPGTRSLWGQLRELTRGARRVFVAGAFYDPALDFVRTLMRELEPDEVILAVEPETVEMPADTAQLPGVRVVRADMLGTDTGNMSTTGRGYLHAKGIFIEPRDGTPVFACGSANPSRAAWLTTPGYGNVEAMVARVGADALATAQSLGFLDIPSMPSLSCDDWQTITERPRSAQDPPHAPLRTGVALSADEEITLRRSDVTDLAPERVELIDGMQGVLCHACELSPRGELLVLRAPPEAVAKAAFVRFLDAEAAVLAQLLVHHATLIEELSRTGIQRRFRDALASLETDAPDLETLLHSVERILFDDDYLAQSTRSPDSQRKAHATAPTATLTTLAIDISETSRRRKSHRLVHGSDLSYLLDVLIYHLRLDGEQSTEELDARGRNEEEQVGADDDDDLDPPVPGLSQEVVLQICHRKVGVLVRRMCEQLNALAGGKRPMDWALVRLIGVLALLRQLRRCDGKAAWVEKGKTTVPLEQRQRLLMAVMYTLFEGDHSLLRLDEVDGDLGQSDDIARLKGLVIWLAWDCGTRFRFPDPYMESPKDREARLKTNAIVVALLQMVRGDEVVIDEAKDCIAGLTTGELDWLTAFLAMAGRIEDVRTGALTLQQPSPSEIAPGDLAVPTRAAAEVRVVAHFDREFAALVALDESKPQRRFRTDSVRILRFSDIAWSRPAER